ncbi:uncharacterized protein LOC120445979 [Drosophila santomea]|nr:uncharacterized protein LOC120445979 [Drosophila santomea]
MNFANFLYFIAIIVQGCRAPACFSRIKFDSAN